MTLAELRVLEDILRTAGLAHLTLWHLRCVDAYLANIARTPSIAHHPCTHSMLGEVAVASGGAEFARCIHCDALVPVPARRRTNEDES